MKGKGMGYFRSSCGEKENVLSPEVPVEKEITKQSGNL